MRRYRMIGLSVVAVLAMSAVAAASASAEAPEFGRCVKKAKKSEGAGFSDKSCTVEVGSGAKYEWVAGAGPKPKFTTTARFVFSRFHRPCSLAAAETRLAAEQRAHAAEVGEPEKAELIKEAEHHETRAREHLEAIKLTLAQCEARLINERAKTPAVIQAVGGGTVVECGEVAGGGEVSGPKSLGNLTLKFTECEMSGTECASSGAAEGEIVSSSLSGVLGVLKKAELGRKAVVGLALYASGGTAFAFTCGTETVTVTGSAIHEVKTDVGQSKEFFTFVQHKGVQEPEAFEGEAPDVLQSSISAGPAEQAGLTLRALSKNEEKVEVNAFA